MIELTWRGKQHITVDPYDDSMKRLVTVETVGPATEQQASGQPETVWHNRLISGDRGDILPALLAEFANSVDLIYVDPPFMTGRNFTVDEQVAYTDSWNHELETYLQWLYETLQLLYRLLASHGSLYLHLDWRAAHYARVMLDEIFGYAPNGEGSGFKNEIIWHYQTGGRSHRHFARKHDTLLLYTKSAQYVFHPERIGERRGSNKRNHMRKQVDADGHTSWTIRAGGKIYSYDEDSYMTPADVWLDISHLHQKDPERNGYATQKPEALLERILLASSEEHDLVLDCCCGSGVTPAVAERLGRRWIASDQSQLAIQLTRQRLLAQPRTCPFVLQQVSE